MYRNVSSIIVRRMPLSNTASTDQRLTLINVTRKPFETVYLLVRKPRKNHAWQFPQGGQDEGETAAEAALRELEEECGSSLKVKLIDNMPIGHYSYKFPKGFNRSDNTTGAKVSFFRADYCEGECRPDGKEIIDYAWLSKEELEKYIHPEYKDAVKSLLE